MSIACNVVLLPDKELAGKAVTASRQLSSQGAIFTLEAGRLYPHLSVFMFQLDENDIPKANKILAELATGTGKFDLDASKYFQVLGYLDVEYRKIEGLISLQDLVVNRLNPLRDGMRENDIPRMAEATGLELENYKKYGWKSIGELYRPHLTLTRFIAETNGVEDGLPAVAEFSGSFSSIGLFEMGENGTAIRKIGEFELKG